MFSDRAEHRKKLELELAELKRVAIAALELRGYDVRGKTTTQIRAIIRRHPTRSRARAGH